MLIPNQVSKEFMSHGVVFIEQERAAKFYSSRIRFAQVYKHTPETTTELRFKLRVRRVGVYRVADHTLSLFKTPLLCQALAEPVLSAQLYVARCFLDDAAQLRFRLRKFMLAHELYCPRQVDEQQLVLLL